MNEGARERAVQAHLIFVQHRAERSELDFGVIFERRRHVGDHVRTRAGGCLLSVSTVLE